jgi:hypothetical protein
MSTTFQQHVSQEQKRFPGATGEFTRPMSGISLATKMTQAQPYPAPTHIRLHR